jgi:hypothetical protein
MRVGILVFLFGMVGCGTSSVNTSTETTLQAGVTVEWDGACNPFNISGDCLTPFPAMWHYTEDESSPTGLRSALDNSQLVSDAPFDAIDLSILNGADGASPLMPMMVNFGVDVDPSLLSGWTETAETLEPQAPIAVVNLRTGESLPVHTSMDQANREVAIYDARHPLVIRPMAPMAFGERYAVVLTNALVDVAGNPLPTNAVFEHLRDGVITSNEDIEEMRPQMDAMFDGIVAAGWAREDLFLAWEVPISSEYYSLNPILSMKAMALDQIDSAGIAYTIDSVEVEPTADIALRVEGTFTPPNFLNKENNLEFGDNGDPLLQSGEAPSYPFTLALPYAAYAGGELRLLLVGHGLFGNGNSMLTGIGGITFGRSSNDLDMVMVATDWIGLSSGDYDLIANEILTDLNKIRLVTDRLVQSHINQLTLVELVHGALLLDPEVAIGEEEMSIREDGVHYYGISLGGIQGTGTVAISDRIQTAVLAVPGAGWSNMIQRSSQFEALELVFDIFIPDPLAQMVFVAGSQVLWDWSEPGILGSMLRDHPYKTVILQEAIGDCQVPNIATDLLVRAIGASHLEEATDPLAGVDTVNGPATGMLLTQIRVPDELDFYFPPDANVTPDIDNGVHNSAVLQEATLFQAEELARTGMAMHPCDGVCDPD